MLRRAPLICGCVVLLACGGGGAGGGRLREADRGDGFALPDMLTLPSVDVEDDELGEQTRFGWMLAEESFAGGRPPAPPAGETVDYQRWTERELAPWLERKATTVAAARRELDAAADRSVRERIIAGAIVGLMYEDVARQLRGLPIPAEIQREPEIAVVFRSILVSHARPYLVHARRAFDACSANAAGGPAGMRHWGEYCADRASMLPPDD